MKVIVIHEFDYTNNTYGVIGVVRTISGARSYIKQYYGELQYEKVVDGVEHPILLKIQAVVPDALSVDALVDISLEEFELERV